MRVLVISHLYPSTANPTAGLFVHEQVKALIEKGVEVRVVSPVPWAPFPIKHLSSRWCAYSRIPRQAVWEDIPIVYPRYVLFPRNWLLSTSGYRMYLGIRSSVERMYQEFPFDLIHAHVALPDGYAGALLAPRLGRPLVVTIHGQDLLRTIHLSSACRWAVARSLRAASRVIVVSNKLRRLAHQEIGSSEKVDLVPNGLDPAKIARAEARRGKEGNEGPTVLSVSNLRASKGIDLNIRAIERLIGKYPSLRYEIIGSGPEEGKLRRLGARLADRIAFLGHQPHERALERMASCTVFSLPSWSEGFGIVYLEAMALGKPVIGCSGEGPEDFIQHGRNGLLVRPRDVDSLVEALDFLLSHPDEAEALGARAREVLRTYTWQESAERVLQVYQEVRGGR